MGQKIFLCIIVWLSISFNAVGQDDFYTKLSQAALQIINPHIVYTPAYIRIPYPNGDVPATTGVCTDVIIRAYRKLGIDLQKEVHEDMKSNFSVYPKNWGLKRPDSNIDHRRVPNLMTFFSRKGISLSLSDKEKDYMPGDIVCWRLSNGMTHIGIVVDKKVPSSNRYKIIHNIGYGQVVEDCLFNFEIIGHYRYKR
ncbi:MAG: DUF1287 domain-containing protein [Bacteroides sp.]|nr:DUF1287 domain-containing protein [Bacteroides sp.]